MEKLDHAYWAGASCVCEAEGLSASSTLALNAKAPDLGPLKQMG